MEPVYCPVCGGQRGTLIHFEAAKREGVCHRCFDWFWSIYWRMSGR